MKTSELTDIALDWAVAEAAGLEYTFDTYIGSDECDPMPLVIVNGRQWNPGTLWSQGGPIIEREQMDVQHYPDHWVAHLWANRNWKQTIPSSPGHEKVAPLNSAFGSGPTLLIAAMRCYVASKLGAEVEIPDELKGEGK